jgi:hypothetical protein
MATFEAQGFLRVDERMSLGGMIHSWNQTAALGYMELRMRLLVLDNVIVSMNLPILSNKYEEWPALR